MVVQRGVADSTAPLQVGVVRLLGYRWPRQTGQTVSGAEPVPEDSLEKLVDEDGIVCIPSVRGEVPAAERFRALLAAAYGNKWSSAKQDELLSTINPQPSTIEDWLRKRPNIKWGKDRGKNPPGSPWGEERDNDRHLTLAEKRAAQGK